MDWARMASSEARAWEGSALIFILVVVSWPFFPFCRDLRYSNI